MLKVVADLRDIKIGDMIITELAKENLIESEVKIKQNRDQTDQENIMAKEKSDTYDSKSGHMNFYLFEEITAQD